MSSGFGSSAWRDEESPLELLDGAEEPNGSARRSDAASGHGWQLSCEITTAADNGDGRAAVLDIGRRRPAFFF